MEDQPDNGGFGAFQQSSFAQQPRFNFELAANIPLPDEEDEGSATVNNTTDVMMEETNTNPTVMLTRRRNKDKKGQ